MIQHKLVEDEDEEGLYDLSSGKVRKTCAAAKGWESLEELWCY